MTDRPARPKPHAAARKADQAAVRQERLAEALRANLRRRKDQVAARGKPAGDASQRGGDTGGGDTGEGDRSGGDR